MTYELLFFLSPFSGKKKLPRYPIIISLCDNNNRLLIQGISITGKNDRFNYGYKFHSLHVHRRIITAITDFKKTALYTEHYGGFHLLTINNTSISISFENKPHFHSHLHGWTMVVDKSTGILASAVVFPNLFHFKSLPQLTQAEK